MITGQHDMLRSLKPLTIWLWLERSLGPRRKEVSRRRSVGRTPKMNTGLSAD